MPDVPAAGLPAAGSESGPSLAVLFVCTANICRSPFAERLARHRVPDGAARFRSAGTHGWDGHPVEEAMAAELRSRGADPDGFASRRLSPSLVDEADLVLTMESAHRSYLLVDRPEAFRRIFTLRQLAGLLEELPGDLHGRELVRAAGRAVRPATAADDVPDPYGRGPEAARLAAAQIDALLHALLPRFARTPPA